MLKKPTKLFAYTAIHRDEKGFTFISMLLMMTILAVSLPFLAYLTKSATYTTNFDDIAIRQFFQFLRDETIKATAYHVDEGTLTLKIDDDDKNVTIERYKDLIRRQVDRKGHEIYLQGVQDLGFTAQDYGFRVTVTSLEGERYEKTIIYYK